MSKIIQCIPNFSEGRRPEVVQAIVDAIAGASKVRVIDHSMDPDHNRCVVTFVGTPDDVRKSAVAGARAAVGLIDLNKHVGGHQRIGAVDVIPVVPIQGVTMAEAVALSQKIGADIARQLLVPVYLYEQSATAESHVNLAHIRKGGFEELKQARLEGDRKPDLGPCKLHETAGAVAVGARGPLVAFNVNLATDDIAVARAIAAKMRRLRDSGEALPGVKAIGVYLKSRNLAQVSMNITQPEKVSMHAVYSFIESEARAMGVRPLESELIGAIRSEANLGGSCSSMKLAKLATARIIDTWVSPPESDPSPSM